MSAAGRSIPGPARPRTKARTLERSAKRFLSRLLASALPARRWTAEEIRAHPVRHLLVVRQHNQMGDMVCALPALRVLRRAHPGAHLTFVAAPLCEELLRGHPDIDTLRVFRKQDMWNPMRLWRFLRDLRRPRPDLAVVLTTVSFSTTSALLAWASGARCRVGGSSLPFGSHLSRAVYNLELPQGPEGVHEVEHNLAPLRALGLEARFETPVLVPGEAALAAAAAFESRGLAGQGPLLAVHAGAGKRPNVWPAEKFAAAVEVLRQQHDVRVVLIEGPTDAQVVEEVARRLPGAARWRAALDATCGLLARAAAVLSNDTGLAHVAAAVGAQTVVVFGPTDAARWKPPGPHVRAVVSATGFIADVDVDAVVHAVQQALAAAAGKDCAPRRPDATQRIR